MVDFTKVQSRKISGKGILKVPDEALEARAWGLIATVDRLPINSYLNNDYNPPQQKFGTLTFLRDENVIRTEDIVFQNQSWDIYPPYDIQNFLALKCAYQGILQTFANLGNALSLPPIILTNQIKEWDYLVNYADTIQVVCWSSTVLILDLYTQDTISCDDEVNKKPKKPPKPPESPPPPKPPTQGVPPTPNIPTPDPDISPPYDPDPNDPTGSTGDGGKTKPYSGDGNPTPPPQGNYKIDIVGTWYGAGCAVIGPDTYASITNTGSGNYQLQNTGTGDCGGQNFIVRDVGNNVVIFTSTSPGLALTLNVLQI